MSVGAEGALLDDFVDLEPRIGDFRQQVLAGLAAPQKVIPSKFFYDDAGSRLFERICTLEEYYPTRTEIGILSRESAALGALLPPGASVIEFGSGSADKMRLFVGALRRPQAYLPVDISRDHLLHNARIFAREHPEVRVIPVCADFTRAFDLNGILPQGPRIGFFPGSTIGNFTPDEAAAFLRGAAGMLARDGFLVIGVDLKKQQETLEAAYNDARGVTAAFNLNLLRRINRELGGTFELDQFAHRAFYAADLGRIEMHLVSRRRQSARVDGVAFDFAAAETIHTENSYKYTVDEFAALAAATGFTVALTLTDADDLFAVHCLRVAYTSER